MHEAPDEEAENAQSWHLCQQNQTAEHLAAEADIAHSRRLRRED